MTYSTTGEDDAIFDYFQKRGLFNGRFLDIGAANGITLSNTHLLVKNGWNGVCIDANVQELFNLNNLYWDNPNVEIVEGCISDTKGLKEFWNAKSANISTSSKRMQDRGREREGARKVLSAGFVLDDIWQYFGYDFHYISLDLEDDTLPIMRGLPMDRLTSVRAIVVEALKEYFFGEDEAPEVIAWGEKWGFKSILRNDENVVLVR